MPDPDLIPAETVESLIQQGGVAIVVGLPSFNHVATLPGVITAIRQGLAAAFPGQRALIVNTDSGSTDGTAQQAAAMAEGDGIRLVQAVLPAQAMDMPYHGIPGKSQGLHQTLRLAKLTSARACIMLSPDFTALAPEWIGMLGRPILEQGFDFAVPLYARHKFDGAITNAIVRPLVRSLYGRHMRQPMGGEYAFSSALVESYLGANVWGTDLARYGTDIWTTTQVLCGPWKLCQVRLGEKTQAVPETAPNLGTILTQVLGSLFEDMIRNAAAWQRVRGAQAIPIFGPPSSDVATTATFDVRRLFESFQLGFRNLQDLWAMVLPPATLLDLRRIAAAPAESFAMPDALWCRVVFDFALGYRMRTINRNHLLGAFLPLYLGWVASFVREMQEASHAESEQRLERLCQTYEAQKPYLISRWRSPDRFNP